MKKNESNFYRKQTIKLLCATSNELYLIRAIKTDRINPPDEIVMRGRRRERVSKTKRKTN